jgi:capsular polysaccharide biosynthesis protein
MTSVACGATELRPKGSLALSPARELTALRSVPGAYRPDGRVAEDTLRLWGAASEQRGGYRAPQEPPACDPVECHEEPVLWGGGMLSPYGHFVIESVSRLWPLLPGAELEGLPVVFVTPVGHRLVREWLDAFGARRVALPKRSAVRFARMHVSEPAWQIDAWAAPEIREIHLQVRRNLEIPEAAGGGVLWLSRSRLQRRRRAYDECLLEWILEPHVTILHPQEQTLPEQVAAIEAAGAVVGIIGSAFHGLLMAMRVPRHIYLCPDPELAHFNDHRFQDAYAAQDWMLGVDGTYLRACVPTGVGAHRFPGGYPLTFPADHRLLIPEVLQALAKTELPDLLDDPRAAALAHPERARSLGARGVELAASQVLLDPVSAEARLALGAEFEVQGLGHCALEQLLAAADLAENPAPVLRRAARVTVRLGDGEEAAEIASKAAALG